MYIKVVVSRDVLAGIGARIVSPAKKRLLTSGVLLADDTPPPTPSHGLSLTEHDA